jgi:Protein of unknown function (DUF2846)
MQKIGPPRAGQSRIVVLRERGYAGLTDPGWDVKLDGAPMADLKTGTYVYVDRPPGRHQLSATATLFPGVSQRDISTQSGRTYFFLARPSEMSLAGCRLQVVSPVCSLAPRSPPATTIPGRSISFRWRKTRREQQLPSFDWRNSVRRVAGGDWTRSSKLDRQAAGHCRTATRDFSLLHRIFGLIQAPPSA